MLHFGKLLNRGQNVISGFSDEVDSEGQTQFLRGVDRIGRVAVFGHVAERDAVLGIGCGEGVGTVGGGGITLKKNGGWDTCSTGYHLHYTVARGFYLGGGKDGYSNYSTFISKLILPPNMPTYGKWFYSRI